MGRRRVSRLTGGWTDGRDGGGLAGGRVVGRATGVRQAPMGRHKRNARSRHAASGKRCIGLFRLRGRVVRDQSCSLVQSIGRSVVRSVAQSVDRSVGRSVGRTIGRSVGQSFGRSDNRSTGRLVIPSVGQLVGRSVLSAVRYLVVRSARVMSVGVSAGQSLHTQADVIVDFHLRPRRFALGRRDSRPAGRPAGGAVGWPQQLVKGLTAGDGLPGRRSTGQPSDQLPIDRASAVGCGDRGARRVVTGTETRKGREMSAFPSLMYCTRWSASQGLMRGKIEVGEDRQKCTGSYSNVVNENSHGLIMLDIYIYIYIYIYM